MNINDARINCMLVILKKYLNGKSFEKVMKRIFENLNYNEDFKLTEILLFDEVIKNEKEKITGAKFFEIKDAFYKVFHHCSSWKTAGYNVKKLAKEIEKKENMYDVFEEILEFEEFNETFYEKGEYSNVKDDDLPFYSIGIIS